MRDALWGRATRHPPVQAAARTSSSPSHVRSDAKVAPARSFSQCNKQMAFEHMHKLHFEVIHPITSAHVGR